MTINFGHREHLLYMYIFLIFSDYIIYNIQCGNIVGCQDASSLLPKGKAVTREDAEVVVAAEIGNQPGMLTHPDGVAASMAAAAQLNQNKKDG